MAKSTSERARRKKRIADLYETLQQRFPEVEQVGTTRFLVWGSARFKHRPYLEIWLDDDFLDHKGSDLLAYSERILSEAEAVLENPDQTIRKQGEILASGRNGITVRRGVDIYRLDGAATSRPSDPTDREPLP
jgi:hypothetical protein